MRFSLKSFLLLNVILAFAFAWYAMHRQAELGVLINVPKPISLDAYYEVPSELLEIRSRRQVREHEREFANADERDLDERVETLRKKISMLFFPSRQLLTERRDELLQIAHDVMSSKPSFLEAAYAAKLLDLCDEPDGFELIRRRFLEQRPTDKDHYGTFIYLFRDANLVKDPAILKVLKQLAADKESNVHQRVCHLLYNEGIDRKLYVEIQREEAKSGLRKLEALIWLMDHQLDEQTIELIEHHVEKSAGIQLGPILSRVSGSTEPKLTAIAQRIEQLLSERLRNLARTSHQDPAPRLSRYHQLEAFQLLGEHCTEYSIPFFQNARNHLEYCEPEEQIERVAIAGQALNRLGRQAEAVKILQSKIEGTNNASGLSQDRSILFEALEAIMEKEELVDFCLAQLLHKFDQAAAKTLGTLLQGTSNEQVVDAIVHSELNTDNEQSLSIRTLKSVMKIGSTKLPELVKHLQESDDGSQFYRHWISHQTTRQEFVDWINQELAPKRKLTIDRVLANPRYRDGNHWVWHDVMWEAIEEDENATLPIETDQQFAMIALAHSGYGNFVYDDRFPAGAISWALCDDFADIESPEFRATSHAYDWDGALNKNSLVVNDRLYKFELAEGMNGSDDRYSSQAAAELLNAIAIRQKLSGRFFCYANEWDVTLVMYMTPEQAIELENEFGISPMAGFEFYLKH